METSLLFDLDGTLIDSCPGIAASLSIAFDSVNRVMPAADLRRALGPPIRIIAARIEPTLTDAELTQIEKVYRSHYDTSGWRETLLFDGVGATLRALQLAGARMFIVTNKPRLPTMKILTHLDLSALFEDIYTRDSRAPSYDNKSEMIATLLRQHSLESAATIMVGDTAEDQEAALSNHLSFVFASYGYGAVESSHQLLSSFSNLLTLFPGKAHSPERMTTPA